MQSRKAQPRNLNKLLSELEVFRRLGGQTNMQICLGVPTIRVALSRVSLSGLKEEVHLRLIGVILEEFKKLAAPAKRDVEHAGVAYLLHLERERVLEQFNRRCASEEAKRNPAAPSNSVPVASRPDSLPEHVCRAQAEHVAQTVQPEPKRAGRGRPRKSEEEKRVPVTVHLDSSLKDQLEACAKEGGRSLTALCRDVLADYACRAETGKGGVAAL